jgi:RimJ/RimL family protein N-acetyltransferase
MIRHIEERDSLAFVELNRQLDTETKFMLFEPGERALNADDQLGHIKRIRAGSQQIVLVAEEEGELVGFLGATIGGFRRNRHSANLAMGVLRSSWGKGLGGRLLDELERLGRERGLARLEFTVMAHNQRAIALYHRHGFFVEGRRCHALCIDDRFVDEYWMGKLLG